MRVPGVRFALEDGRSQREGEVAWHWRWQRPCRAGGRLTTVQRGRWCRLVTGLGGAASSSEAGSTLLCGPSVAGVEVCVLRLSIVTCYPTLGTVGFRIFGVTVLVAGARAVVLCYVMLW